MENWIMGLQNRMKARNSSWSKMIFNQRGTKMAKKRLLWWMLNQQMVCLLMETMLMKSGCLHITDSSPCNRFQLYVIHS
nr:hypothetical protein Iba_chr03aCG0280 [Ipomoea batatas]GMC71177.1 hypothetical protein Iba_chr03bCG0330 [Ipomoea batatas]GMC74930.1 hypothetical protein Iba_chr03dCG0300 [Ipomoea batatas]